MDFLCADVCAEFIVLRAVEVDALADGKVDGYCPYDGQRTLALGGKLLITADHGNCEQMRNPDGSPHTAHTTNLVHFLYVAEDASSVKLERASSQT